MAKFKVKIEGYRMYEAGSTDEALTKAALDIKLMDFHATVVGEQKVQGLDANKSYVGVTATMQGQRRGH